MVKNVGNGGTVGKRRKEMDGQEGRYCRERRKGMLEEMGVEKSGGEEWMVGMIEKGLKL